MTTATLQSARSNIWWVFLLQGIAGILLGLMLITDPKETLVVLVTFGVLLFVQGVALIIWAFRVRA